MDEVVFEFSFIWSHTKGPQWSKSQ